MAKKTSHNAPPRPADGLADLNFKVERDFHHVYKLVATLKGMSMKELLEASFHAWVKRFGDDQIKVLVRSLEKPKAPHQ